MIRSVPRPLRCLDSSGGAGTRAEDECGCEADGQVTGTGLGDDKKTILL